MPTEIKDVQTELTSNAADSLANALAALNAELGVTEEQTPEDVAERNAAREWRERMFETYPMLTVEHVYAMSHRRMEKGYFKITKEDNKND